MKRAHIAAMTLALATILHPAPAQVFAPTAGSKGKTDGVQQTEDKSVKPQVKDKKGMASNETESLQHPKDISESGKVFLDGCSSVDKQPNQLSSYETHSNVMCLAYVGGVFETMSLVDNLQLETHGFCAPKQPVQRKKLVQIVRKYIVDHPETSNERTVALVWLALSQAFPCNKAKT